MLKSNKTQVFTLMTLYYGAKNKSVDTNLFSLQAILFYQAKKSFKKPTIFFAPFNQYFDYFDDIPPLITTVPTLTFFYFMQKIYSLVKGCC